MLPQAMNGGRRCDGPRRDAPAADRRPGWRRLWIDQVANVADTDNGVDDAAHGYEGEKPTGRRTERKDARNAQMPRVEPGG